MIKIYSSFTIALLILTGCFPNKKVEPPHTVPPLSFRQVITTAHTHDGQTHLNLHIDTAHCDRCRNIINAHGVRATLTHRNTHTMAIYTPVATWEERTGRFRTQGKTNIQHPHGTLLVDGGTDLRLDQHHLTFNGPLLHTLSF